MEKFQSHLYGIERSGCSTMCATLPVSIAPLWNWKGRGALVPVVVLPFQSHLYGIESWWRASCRWWQCRFNRTFMELKVASRLQNTEVGTRFNRTFMELKVATPSASMAAFCVSIAPLWNWKSTAIGSPDLTRWFQSHLYGIESVQ